MSALTKGQLKEQIVLQHKLFQNLKRWLNIALLISSLLFSMTLFVRQNDVFFWITVILLTLSIMATLIIGLALKRGHDNLNKLVQLLEAK